jgi:hypothetical protein
MVDVLIGLAVLAVILFLLRMFVTANPAALVRALRYAGVAALAGVAAFLVYLRRIDLGFIAGGMAYALYTQGHVFPQGIQGFLTRGSFFRSFLFGGIPGGSRSRRPRTGPQSGQTSRVATAWLDLELDHDTGEMQGMVLQGKFANKALATLSPADLLTFYAEAAAADAEAARLLEAYLDRRLGPDWRAQQQEDKTQQQEPPRSRRDTGMSREEAYAVLGLKTGASEDDIRAAHKKLMMQNHPDRGGSDYLAAKINEAKDVLIG